MRYLFELFISKLQLREHKKQSFLDKSIKSCLLKLNKKNYKKFEKFNLLFEVVLQIVFHYKHV